MNEHTQAESDFAHITRLLRTVSGINQMIVRQSSPSAMLSEACRIFVKTGGFLMAWVGLCSESERHLVPVAAAGIELGVLEQLSVHYDDHPEGMGPSSRAIHSARPVIYEDLEKEAMVAPWRAALLEQGYRSSAMVPIRSGDRVRGVLGVYAAEPAAIRRSEAKILDELADDLGFALQALEDAVAREQSEAALRANEARYRRMLETAAEGIVILDAERHLTFVNQRLCDLLGYEIDELRDASLDVVLFPEDVPAQLKRWSQLYDEVGGHHETRMRRKDGSPRWVLMSTRAIIDEQGRFDGVLSMVSDIHARKLAEERVKGTLKQLRLTVDAAVGALAHTVEIRDPYTAGHQERVSELSVAIGRKLALRSRSITSLRIAGLIHDLGKIAVPAEILSKPGALTEHEWRLLQEHPETAFRVLREMRFPGPVARIVRNHHERLDGSGYPRGLTGDQVRIESRILAVADVVEAMSSHRPYRAALGIDAALEEISAQRDVKYDAQAVDACVALFREEGFAFSTAS